MDESDVVVSDRFREVVALHIAKNLITRLPIRVPLLLGIHGPSGEGKTFQCEAVLKELGIEPLLISGGQLEGPQAGTPAEMLRQTYLRAGKSMEQDGRGPAAVLINDLDTGVGDWGDMVQYTVNRQTVFAELMHLVDYPRVVEGRPTMRVPIIVTGNDFTKLHQPLVRAGRMTAFEWKPDMEETVEIVSSIFPQLGRDQCRSLVSDMASKAEMISGKQNPPPIAFYAHLKAALFDRTLWREMQKHGLRQTVWDICQGLEPVMNLSITLGQVACLGEHVLKSGQLVDHINRGRQPL